MATKSPRVAVRLEPQDKRRIERLAAENRRSVSAEVGLAVLAWLEKYAPPRGRR